MMRLEYQILIALALDFLLGDPRWLPHPVRIIGMLAYYTEIAWRRLFKAKTAGVLTVFSVVAVCGLSVAGLVYGASWLHPSAGILVSIVLLYAAFAVRDLAAHCDAVRVALEKGDINDARIKVAMFVGRDTEQLEEAGIVRAGVESVAENMVDGVIAPLFYAVLFGPIGALIYKAINTMDSMFGYKNKQYKEFGWAAARLDDLTNFIPARISGLFVIVAAFFSTGNGQHAWHIFRRDRLQHASPNSAHTEAAVAGALGLKLGGSSVYFGKLVDKPTIGNSINIPKAKHLGEVNLLLFMTTVLAVSVFLIIRYSIIN